MNPPINPINTSRSTNARWLLPGLATVMTVVSFGALGAGPTSAAPPPSGPGDKVTLCHLTGAGTFVEITVAASAAANGHGQHPGDIIPAPAAGCPTASPTPSGEPAGEGGGG